MKDMIHKDHKSLREAFEKYINSTKKEGFLVFNGLWYALISFHLIFLYEDWPIFCMDFGVTLVCYVQTTSSEKSKSEKCLNSLPKPLSFKIFQQHLISPLACMTEPFQHKTTNLKHNSWTSYWIDIKSRHKNLTMWQLNAMGYSRKEKGSCDDVRTWIFEGYWKRAYFPAHKVPETGGL